MSMKFTITPTHRTWLASLVFLALLSAACTRSVAPSDAEIAAAASQAAIDTEDAGIQLTLEALLGSATVQSAVTATPSATSTVAATATPESAQLTELAATLTAQVDGEVTPEGEEPTETPTPDATVTACYGARYVYDESYPDGTRVDPGQAMAKTWRLQNVGTCNWVSGQYELVFVAGDRMGINQPVTMFVTVPAEGYINFTLNMKAPSEPGTYRGEYMLRTKGGETFGVGPDFDLPIWIEIVVRG